MGKKRFFYGNQRPARDGEKEAAEKGTENAARRGDEQQRRNGGGKKRGDNQPPVRLRYTEEKRALTLADLGVGERLAELLTKNRVTTAGDLVRRTERDMFRIQGFNKKMLVELKKCLAAKGMDFLPEKSDKPQVQPSSETRAENSSDRRSAVRGERPAEGRRGAVSGSVPRRGEKPATQREQKREERKKLTEPLPVEEWKKVQKSGKWGFFDGFNTVIPAIYDEVFCFKDGLASVEQDEKCGYINPAGEVVIPLEYETAMSFSEGFASVVKGGKCGYINKENEVIIPFVYDAATPFEEGEAKVKKDGRWGTILPDGSVKWI